jgi:hypothetical protein
VAQAAFELADRAFSLPRTLWRMRAAGAPASACARTWSMSARCRPRSVLADDGAGLGAGVVGEQCREGARVVVEELALAGEQRGAVGDGFACSPAHATSPTPSTNSNRRLSAVLLIASASA